MRSCNLAAAPVATAPVISILSLLIAMLQLVPGCSAQNDASAQVRGASTGGSPSSAVILPIADIIPTSGAGGQGTAGATQTPTTAEPTVARDPVEVSAAALQITADGVRPGRRFREGLGLSTKFAQGQPQADLAMVTDLGVKWVRDTVDWSIMEPTAGNFIDFPAAFQERLAYYKAHDIGVVFLLAYDAYKAYTPTAANPTAAFDAVHFGNYAVEAAKRLQNAGVRFVLELWNEPHNMVLARVLGGQWNGAPPSPWLDYYVKMVGEAVTRVKAFNSSIRLVTDDDMWIIHYWFLEAGLPKALDGFAFHPYVQGIPEKAAIDANTNWMAPFVGVDQDGAFVSAVSRLRDRGYQKLGKTPGMWITEWGWPIGQATSSGTIFSEDTVAAWLPRAFVLAEASGAEALCWFSTQDSVDGPMGLTTNAGLKRKTYLAFKTLSDNFGDYFFLGQLLGSDHRTTGPQAYLFRRNTGAKMIAWSIEPSQTWLKLDGQLSAAKVIDSFGRPVTPTLNASGVPFVALAAAPIYLAFPVQTTAPALHIYPQTGTTPPQ